MAKKNECQQRPTMRQWRRPERQLPRLPSLQLLPPLWPSRQASLPAGAAAFCSGSAWLDRLRCACFSPDITPAPARIFEQAFASHVSTHHEVS